MAASPSRDAAGGSGDPRATRLLDDLLKRAAERGASDVHLEPRQGRMRTRLRVDGVMVDDQSWPADVAAQVVSRIKVLGRMDIAERRLPQDGMFSLPSPDGAEGALSIRASTFPAMHGEKVVLRLLHGGRLMALDELGMQDGQVAMLQHFCKRQGGLVVVTGPTGAGKTSTLYGMLRELDTKRRNVVTLEDPIEIEMQGITQGQVNRKAGFDFAGGLRAILRQDPDVILVGEMRDAETTRIAVQASLTGHLVLSTLHTNSVPATITRLLDIGLERWLVASALVGIVAQRLVRRSCPSCRALVPADRLARLRAEVGFALPDGAGLTESTGCQACLGTGYRGRTGIFEVAELDDELRERIKGDGGSESVRSWLAARGIPTLRRAGVPLVQSGTTSLSELLRLT